MTEIVQGAAGLGSKGSAFGREKILARKFTLENPKPNPQPETPYPNLKPKTLTPKIHTVYFSCEETTLEYPVLHSRISDACFVVLAFLG